MILVLAVTKMCVTKIIKIECYEENWASFEIQTSSSQYKELRFQTSTITLLLIVENLGKKKVIKRII